MQRVDEWPKFYYFKSIECGNFSLMFNIGRHILGAAKFLRTRTIYLRDLKDSFKFTEISSLIFFGSETLLQLNFMSAITLKNTVV